MFQGLFQEGAICNSVIQYPNRTTKAFQTLLPCNGGQFRGCSFPKSPQSPILVSLSIENWKDCYLYGIEGESLQHPLGLQLLPPPEQRLFYIKSLFLGLIQITFLSVKFSLMQTVSKLLWVHIFLMKKHHRKEGCINGGCCIAVGF